MTLGRGRGLPTCQEELGETTLEHLRDSLGALAFAIAFMTLGTPSAPIASLASTTAGHAFADHHEYDPLDHDADGDGIVDALDGCPHLYATTGNGCPPPRETDEPPPDVPSDPEAVPSPSCGNGSTVAHCTCGRGEGKVYSESRGFYCQGPPHCGDGSGNSDCWCDSGDRKELGSDGRYYCQDPTADGQVCIALMPSAPGVRANPRTGVYIEGACVIDPPSCGEIAIMVAEMGIATSIAGIPAAALATKVFVGATGVGVSLGGLIAHTHCS